MRPLSCGCTRTCGAYTVTAWAGRYGATEACASYGTFTIDGAAWSVRACDFAIAGDASKAATPTADRITFRFVVMFNLMCVSGSGPRHVARIPHGTRLRLITRSC